MDINNIKIGDNIEYIRNNEKHTLKVFEIGNSYGLDKIFYNKNGGFCMGKEIISETNCLNRFSSCMHCGLKNNTPFYCDNCGDLR